MDAIQAFVIRFNCSMASSSQSLLKLPPLLEGSIVTLEPLTLEDKRALFAFHGGVLASSSGIREQDFLLEPPHGARVAAANRGMAVGLGGASHGT